MKSSFLFLLFLALCLITEGAKKQETKQEMVDSQYASLFENCKAIDCKELGRFENMNCIHECISQKCYLSVYEEEPLEPGEIDNVREDRFISCVKEEIGDSDL